MDEEELEQPSSKINLGSFFERVDSVEKVANNALSRANANLGIISNQKLIINSINVTIEAMETKIRDIANYIIIEKKLEKDVEEDRLLEEQDRLQKQAMVERATTIMGEPGPQDQPGQPAEQQKGSSLLGTLLKLGIGAFAIKFLWPALLPLLKGSLAALGKLVFSKLGAGIGAAVGGTILSLPLLKRFRDPFQRKAEELGENTGNYVAEKVNSIDEKGNVDTGSGTEVSSETNLAEGDESMRKTLTEKDLMVTPGTRIDEYGAEGGGEPSSGDLSMFDEDENESNFKTEFKEGSYELSSSEKDGVTNISTKFEGVTRFDVETGKAYILGEEVIKFEKDFAKYTGNTFCLGVSNGLDALFLSSQPFNSFCNSSRFCKSCRFLGVNVSAAFSKSNQNLSGSMSSPDSNSLFTKLNKFSSMDRFPKEI